MLLDSVHIFYRTRLGEDWTTVLLIRLNEWLESHPDAVVIGGSGCYRNF